MATVAITNGEIEHTIVTNDLGAAMVVEALSGAFSHAGGAWIPAEHQDTEVEGAASLRWMPAATTTVAVTFTEGGIPPQLIDLPGFLT